MPRKPKAAPEYKRHPNGSAYVYHRSVDRPGHVLYLGPHGSEKSLRRYRAFLRRLESLQAAAAVQVEPVTLYGDPTIIELVAAYLQHCETYYRHADGRKTSEFLCCKNALAPLVELFGDDDAASFGIEEFDAYRDHLIAAKFSRVSINKHASRVRRMFRWASSKNKVPASVWHSLAVIEGLKQGRTIAKESSEVGAVQWAEAAALLPYLSPVVAAMVEVQYWSGMRPQDVCNLRRADIDTDGDVWIYRPAHHKSKWRGHALAKAIPAFVQRHLSSRFTDDPTAFIFSPREAVAWHAAETRRNAVRTTKEYPSGRRAKELRKAIRAARGPRHRDHYTTDTYRQAVLYGFDKLNAERAKNELEPVKAWTPNQLRHGIATHIERTLGAQAAQRYLGHRHLSTTEIYLEKDSAELVTIARLLANHRPPT